MAAPGLTIVRSSDHDSDATVIWASEELCHALRQRGHEATISAEPSGAGPRVEIAHGAAAPSAPLDLPKVDEGFALWRDGDRIVAWGHDSRGLVHALTELADRARHAHGSDPFAGTFPLTGRPTARVRSIARLFCSEVEDKAWFHDRQQWRDYLTMLASNRFNRFALTLGMGYNYPYHNPWISDVYFYFPYPFLFATEGYGIDVKELSGEERDANLEMLKFIGRETARRGLDFQLALWTQRYDFDDVPNANYTVRGVTDDNLAAYCRDSITRLLREVPEITGLTFRVHVEGGIAEGDYDFWREAFAGVAAAGRPVEIDMHGKGLDQTTIQIARESGMPLAASPKYLAEHMGLPYHQSSIRNEEFPPERARSEREKLSEGSRKFLRYSYGDLLTRDKDYKVIYRIWAGTQRVLLWGDPTFAAGYGRSSMFAGSDGVEWCEPLSFYGRMGNGHPGGRFSYQQQGLATRYDWQKYLYQYRVWGRGLYDPAAPRESWMRFLEVECGDAAEACETGLAHASRVLPLVTLAHGPSASNNHYWPEVYTNLGLISGSGARAYSRDMAGPVRFGAAPTFDQAMFVNAKEYAQLLLAGERSHRYTPLDVADWLDDLADACETALLRAKRTDAFGTAPVRRVTVDVEIAGGIARFFAEKFRAACWTELFLETGVTELIEPALHHARRAVLAWEGVAAASRDVYHDDLAYGPQSWLRGSWHARLEDIRGEVLDLEAARGGGVFETVPMTEKAAAAVAALRGRTPTLSNNAEIEAPATFTAGQPIEVRLKAAADEPPVLHYRHVDQSKRWQSTPMAESGNGYAGTIPGDYTRSDFHLQYFVTFASRGRSVIAPGLDADLANEPYRTCMQN